MRTIDIDAHVVSQGLWRAAADGTAWYGYRHEAGDGSVDNITPIVSPGSPRPRVFPPGSAVAQRG